VSKLGERSSKLNGMSKFSAWGTVEYTVHTLEVSSI